MSHRENKHLPTLQSAMSKDFKAIWQGCHRKTWEKIITAQNHRHTYLANYFQNQANPESIEYCLLENYRLNENKIK